MSKPSSQASTWRRRLRNVQVDLTPLRTSPDFRRLFASGLVTAIGSMVTYVAIPFQVAQLTDSYIAVGLIGLCELVPLVVFGLLGGSLADTVDRRRMVLATEAVSCVLVIVLLVNARSSSPQLWILFVVAALLATSDSLQRPSLDAMTPRVVAHAELGAAAALSTISRNLAMIIGPAIGGLLLAIGGTAMAYGVDAVSFAVSVTILWRLRPIRAERGGDDGPSLAHIAEGLRYAVRRRDLLGTYVVDLIAMIFAFPYALFPFLAAELDATWALGLLYSAGAIGGLAVTATSGWVRHVHHHGRAIVIAAGVWGLGIGLVGIAPGLGWVLLLLAVAGAGDMVSGVFRGMMWNQTIPDEMRGRMAGIEMLSYSVGPLLGQVRSSTAASLTSLRWAFGSGGVLCIAGVAVAPLVLPALWRYDARTDPNAVRERERRAGMTPSE